MKERQKGYVVTEETKAKIRAKAKERVGEKNNRFGKKHSEKTIQKMRDKAKGKNNHSSPWLKNNPPRRGIKTPIEVRLKQSASAKENVKNGTHNLWKGGVSSINKKIRASIEYREWKISVFIRDNRTCLLCGYKGNKIEADHIKPFSLFPELRFDINNGRTLCQECHRKTPTYGYRNIEKYKKGIL